MIKFFRKIRQTLLSENKTGKYFKYAFGEIILVVIGILIALQINNWNDNRKNQIEEKAVLESLLENLSLAKIQSQQLIKEEVALKNGLMMILGVAPNPTGEETIPDSIFKSAVWDLQSNKPTFNSYSNLKNTNKLSLIKNKKVSEKFTDIEFSLNRLSDILEDRLSVHQIRIDDILEHEINFILLLKSTIPEVNIEQEEQNDYYTMLTSKRVRNLLGMKLSFTQDVIDRRNNLDKEIDQLIVLIKDDLGE
jgi:hypothetical protein